MSKYGLLTIDELQAILQRLRARHEDLEEAITFYLTHSAAHINSGEVRQDEETLRDMKEEIAGIERHLTALES